MSHWWKKKTHFTINNHISWVNRIGGVSLLSLASKCSKQRRRPLMTIGVRQRMVVVMSIYADANTSVSLVLFLLFKRIQKMRSRPHTHTLHSFTPHHIICNFQYFISTNRGFCFEMSCLRAHVCIWKSKFLASLLLRHIRWLACDFVRFVYFSLLHISISWIESSAAIPYTIVLPLDVHAHEHHLIASLLFIGYLFCSEYFFKIKLSYAIRNVNDSKV